MTIECYFMENKEWYEQDEDGNIKLTEKAPPEAVRSFEDYKAAREWYENIIYQELCPEMYPDMYRELK